MRTALIGAPWLHAMARIFEAAHAPLYVVGGAVRNPLIGLPLSDVDVCGPTRPEAVCALCEGTAVRAHLRAAHFGTVELHIEDETGRHMAEYTTFRRDSYRCGHKPEQVQFTTDIGVDALRRDFSVNALYRRVYTNGLGEVIDPTGGLAHLREGILHTVTADPDQVLRDDGLRILRAARFQAEMDLAPTAALMDSLARYAHLLGDIACERLRDELAKVLMADLRYPTLSRRRPATQSGLTTIAQIGAWPQLFPHIAYDAAAAEALVRLQAPLSARMALLLRRAAPEAAAAAMDRLRFSQKDQADTQTLLTAMQALAHGMPERFAAVRWGGAALTPAAACFAALKNQAALQRAHALQAALAHKPQTLKQLAVNGNDLTPLLSKRGVPMRETGRLLQQLWQAAVEGECANTREALLALAERLL